MEKNLPSGQVLTRKSYQRQPPLNKVLSPIYIITSAKIRMTRIPINFKNGRPISAPSDAGANLKSTYPARIAARNINKLELLNDIHIPPLLHSICIAGSLVRANVQIHLK
jgi:hypothetical protein